MKKKILTLLLSTVMIFSLAACGSKEEPVAETEASSEETTEQASESSEPEPEEPEHVELTADTIDKYFGFKYTDVADEAITGFTVTTKQGYGTATLNVARVPMAYSEADCPSMEEFAKDWNEYLSKDENNSAAPYFMPFTNIHSKMGNVWNQFYYVGHVSLDEGENVAPYNSPDESAYAWAVDNNLPAVYYRSGEWEEQYENYPIMQPDSVMNAFDNEYRKGFLITNHNPEYASVDTGEVTGLFIPFGSDRADVTVAGFITADSTIKDVVAKYAPTEGTMLDNGAIVLTWKTASGTTTEITFSINEYKAMSVSILAPNMTPEILQGLGLN